MPRSLGLLLRAAGLFATFAALLTWPARLFDADSYLHLALARTIGAHGFVDHLEWARWSTLGRTYGDKELLFHLLLVPFVKLGDAEFGGKVALALLCTVIAFSLWELGTRALGRSGFFLPVLVFGSGSFMLRAIRLRPELLSLVFAIWVVWALAERRYLIATLLSLGFSLSHTAFHSLFGLALLFLAWQRWSERRWEWQLMASVTAGVAAGVLLHPQFPRNLSVFWVQNFEFFRLRDRLDVGGEFQPYTLTSLLQLDGLFWLGLLVVVAASRRSELPLERWNASGTDTARRMASFCWITAAAFGLLFLGMGRFATLAIPFAALACSFELAARGHSELGPRLRLPGGRTVSRRVAITLIAALSCANGFATAFVNWRMADSFDRNLRGELQRLALQLPLGSTVAANWDDAELYAFHAPHARYLNIYDPVFMAVGDPERHAIWREVLAGSLPDIPDAVHRVLESEYLAFSTGSHPALERRLAHDPRVRLLHRGRHSLFRIQSRDARFVTDWTAKSSQSLRPIVTPSTYLDVRTLLGPDGCTTLTHRETVETAQTRLLELAAWGPAILFVDGKQVLQLATAHHAQLGEGPALAVQLDPGEHRWQIRTCGEDGQAGFYLVDRGER